MNEELQRHINVSVFDRMEFVEARSCSSAMTPDGGRGVLYRGLVHPLLAGDRIDLSGPAHVPGAAPVGPSGRAARRHAIVTGDLTGYVLIEGSVADRELAAAALRAAGASVMRTGRFLGEPLDALSPDWFVRFEIGAGTFDEIGQAVAAALAETPAGTADPAALRLRLLTTELAEARARTATLEAENARLRVERAEAQAARQGEDAEAMARLETERAALSAALEAEIKARAAAEALSAETKPALPAPIAAPKGLKAEIACVLETLMPRIRPIGDSLVVLAVEYRERSAVYRALAQLDASSSLFPSNWKKLKDVEGWWERHVSDGASDAGRIYARLNSQDRVYDLLVSTKGEQTRDLAWLRKR